MTTKTKTEKKAKGRDMVNWRISPATEQRLNNLKIKFHNPPATTVYKAEIIQAAIAFFEQNFKGNSKDVKILALQ